MINCNIGKTRPLIDMVNGYLLYTYQTDSEKYLPNYLKFASDVYSDMQFNILTSEIKKIYTIDKKLGTVKLPDDLLYLQQVSAIHEEDETLIPLLEDNGVLLPYEEVVAKELCPNPNCKVDICSDVRAITSVSETVTIDDVDYTNVISTQLLPDGSVIEKNCRWYAVPSYTHDYTLSMDYSVQNETLYSITINGTIYIINQNFNNLTNVANALNALDLGVFTVVQHPFSVFVIVSSANNPNILTKISIVGYITNDIFFDSSDEQLVITAEEKCTTVQKCKLELDEDLCVIDTPENKVKVQDCCCNFFRPCNKRPLPAPTMSELDGTLYFSNNNYDRVLIVYKTSGINFGQTTMVPEIAEQAMISGLTYYALKHKHNISEREKENARKIYNIDKNKLVQMLFPIRIQEIINASRVTKIIY